MSILYRLLRPLLFPFSLLYGSIIWLRNKLYDKRILRSIRFNFPVISIGNLSTGGTGKTPHIEYLIRLLQPEYRMATLSRGYKRKTKGFLLATDTTTSTDIGDEPFLFYRKHPDTTVSVCEERLTGIPRLLGEHPETEVILLDDAFQHRAVKPGLNILLTDYERPFYKDFILPFGNLREGRKAYRRAHIIIVSKCPPHLEQADISRIIAKIKPDKQQQVFFSGVHYDELYDFYTGQPVAAIPENIVMISGIAQPEPMRNHLQQKTRELRLLQYADHHYFTQTDLERIRTSYQDWHTDGKMIITTEKDAARLELHKEQLAAWALPIAILPIKVHFLEGGTAFERSIKQYVTSEIADNKVMDSQA